ncbi:MAG TPA: 2-oxoglutarate dehydrogenase complex dihydrolipoyllysine-residue succinyltransferase [Chthoniobacterales bacterium]|nr:2-oxoglutarate dehydrogenase complex dihydrolipoyllysine-residue succinyltransferase [Chthoniobacterales bacterium]
MSVQVKIPAVGESISSGVVSVWHKKSGEQVKKGDPLFTLETDKVSTEIVAETDGVLRTKATEGQEVKIGEVVAEIEETPAPAAASREEEPAPPVAVVANRGEPKPSRSSGATEVSPAVRRIIDEEKLDSSKISGTGKGGRVTKGDALAAAQNRAAAGPDEMQATAQVETLEPGDSLTSPAKDSRVVRKRMSPLRRKIAQQLVMAQNTAAILTTFNECDMSEVQALRAYVQERFTKKNGVKLGLMSFFVKATVAALKAVPVINGRIEGDDFIQNNFYDIGVAVGTERGLVVPVVRDADKKSFAEVERDIAEYAKKAREGKLKIEELQGGTFTISNGGVYGSLMATPILNPPQSGILGMHKIMERPIALNGAVVVRPMMYLALSYDHRLIDGKEAVTFLIKVKEGIENPKTLPIDV